MAGFRSLLSASATDSYAHAFPSDPQSSMGPSSPLAALSTVEPRNAERPHRRPDLRYAAPSRFLRKKASTSAVGSSDGLRMLVKGERHIDRLGSDSRSRKHYVFPSYPAPQLAMFQFGSDAFVMTASMWVSMAQAMTCSLACRHIRVEGRQEVIRLGQSCRQQDDGEVTRGREGQEGRRRSRRAPRSRCLFCK